MISSFNLIVIKGKVSITLKLKLEFSEIPHVTTMFPEDCLTNNLSAEFTKVVPLLSLRKV